MVELSYDTAFFNAVSNHPKVRPWVAPASVTGDLDVGPLFDIGAVGLRTKNGGFILIPKGQGEWEPHGFFMPQPDRFHDALGDTVEATEWAFRHLGGIQALALRVPLGSSHRGTGDLLTKVGFLLVGGDDDFDGYRLTANRYKSLRASGYYDTMSVHSS